eukprot:scaffold11434_cov127-Isochrysis_galbana.AAC.12
MAHPPLDEPIVLGIYEELWRANARVRIPDTVLWKQGQISAWFFTSSSSGNGDGPELKRKKSTTLRRHDVTAKIVEAFTKGFAGGEHEAVARYIGGKSPGGPASVVHLTKAGLLDFLQGKAAAEAKRHGVLQRWFPPSGENAYGVRCTWSSHRCGIEVMQNAHSHRDARFNIAERLATFEGPCRSAAAVATTTANLRRSATELADRAASALDALLMPMRRVWGLELSLIADARGVYHLSWCSSIALAERREDGSYHKTYVTPDPERAAALRAYEETRRAVEAGKVRYGPKLEEKQRERLSLAGPRWGVATHGAAADGEDEADEERHDGGEMALARQGLPPELEGIDLDDLDAAEAAHKEMLKRERAAARAAERQAESQREPAALARAHKLFDELDTAGSGSVSRSAYTLKLQNCPLLENLLRQADGSGAKRNYKMLLRLDADGSHTITWDEFVSAAGLMGIEAFWSTSATEAAYYDSLGAGDKAEKASGIPPQLAYVPPGYVPKPPPRGPAVRDGTIFHVPALGMTTYHEPAWMARSYAPEIGSLPQPPLPTVAPIGGPQWLPLHLRHAVFGEDFSVEEASATSLIDEETLTALAAIQARLEAGQQLSQEESETLRMCEQIADGEAPAEAALAQLGTAAHGESSHHGGASRPRTASVVPPKIPELRRAGTEGRRHSMPPNLAGAEPFGSTQPRRVAAETRRPSMPPSLMGADPETMLAQFRIQREAEDEAEARQVAAERAALAMEKLAAHGQRAGVSSAAFKPRALTPRSASPRATGAEAGVERPTTVPGSVRWADATKSFPAQASPPRPVSSRPSVFQSFGRHFPTSRPSTAEMEMDIEVAARSANALFKRRQAASARGASHARATAGLDSCSGSSSRPPARLQSAPVNSPRARLVPLRANASAPSSNQLPSLRPTAPGGMDDGWAALQSRRAEELLAVLPRSMLRAVRSYTGGMVDQASLFQPNLLDSAPGSRQGSARRRPVSSRGVRGLKLQSEFAPPAAEQCQRGIRAAAAHGAPPPACLVRPAGLAA